MTPIIVIITIYLICNLIKSELSIKLNILKYISISNDIQEHFKKNLLKNEKYWLLNVLLPSHI